MTIVVDKKKTNKKGFSLIEVLIAMFVFAIMTLVVMGTFFDMIKSRSRVLAIQQDVEDARYGMELMAKTLRMSSVFSISSGGSIEFYDYSRAACFRYRIQDGGVIMETGGIGTVSWHTGADSYKSVDGCNVANDIVSSNKIIDGSVGKLWFDIKKSITRDIAHTPPIAGSFGHVTIAMQICYEGNCDNGNDMAIIQSSVSLRDYGFVNGN
jgi:prepilin-type N-terminal cleavage/methylation domain-containing protein